MILSRNKFKNAPDFCKKNEFLIRKQVFLKNKNPNSNKNIFWKEVRKLKSARNCINSCIDDSGAGKCCKYVTLCMDPE